MSELFLSLFNRSVSAVWLILAVLLLRPVMRKVPKSIHCLLWAVVGVRLALPFSIQSALSLVPSAQVIHPEYLDRNTLQITTGLQYVNSRVNNYLGNRYYEGVTVPSGFLEQITQQGGLIWLTGLSLMLFWMLLSWHRLHRQVASSVPEGEGVYRCDDINAPFVLGVFRPRIYLPSALPTEDAVHVIAHERAHIRRRDHWWKPLGFLLLAVHWFNPAVWLAYTLLCRDIELACDERVIRELGDSAKADYSRSLLRCAAGHLNIAACPLAFGESNVKQRVQSVLHYRRPAFWMLAVSIALCAVVAVCFLTDPPEQAPAPVSDPAGISAQQNRVTVANPFSSAHPNTYTDPVVVERIYDIFQNLSWTEVPASTEQNFDLQTWISVGLMYGGQQWSITLDRNGLGHLYRMGGEAYTEIPTLQFDRSTCDFDYLWLLYTGSHDADEVHTDSYIAGALLGQSLALSYLPADGSAYAQVQESGKLLIIRGKDGAIMFSGSRIKEQTRSRTRAQSALRRFGEPALEDLLPKNVRTVTIRVYESQAKEQFSIWELHLLGGGRWLWLAEGGENPLRLYELINMDESFHPGVECWLWTRSLTTPTLPIQFSEEFTAVSVTVDAGTISTEPPHSYSLHTQPTDSITLQPGDTLYWLLPGGEDTPDTAKLSYTVTDADGKNWNEIIEIRRLSLAESLYGSVTYGVSQNWLGLLSSHLCATRLTAEDSFHGLSVTGSDAPAR